MRVFLKYVYPSYVYLPPYPNIRVSLAPSAIPCSIPRKPSSLRFPRSTYPFLSIRVPIVFDIARKAPAEPPASIPTAALYKLKPPVKGAAPTAIAMPSIKNISFNSRALRLTHPLILVSFASSFDTSCVPHGSISPTGLFPQNAYVSAKNPVPVTAGSGSVDRNRRDAGSATRAPITSRPAADTLPAPLNTNPAGNPAPACEENSASTLGRIVALGVPQGFIPPAVPTCENPPSEPGAGMPPAPITEGISATGFGSHTSGTDAPSAPVT